MANEDLKDILKKGSKAKLIQLAIEFREFTTDNLMQRTFTDKEVEEVKERAKKEGWDKELFRATYKARDIEAITLVLKGQIYEAIYYLHELLKELQRVEIILDMLRDTYIGDYNEDTEKFETIVSKPKKEMEEDINKAKRLVINTLEDITDTKLLMQYGNDLIDKGEDKRLSKELGRKLTKEDLFNILYRNYKRLICSVKVGYYMLLKSDLGEYRLYKKEQYEEVKKAFITKNILLVGNVTLSLDHLDYLLEVIEENKPELLEITRQDKDMFIPDRKWVKEVSEYLDKYILPPLKNKDKKMFNTKEYLLNELEDKEIEQVEKANKVLEEYVLYGK